MRRLACLLAIPAMAFPALACTDRTGPGDDAQEGGTAASDWDPEAYTSAMVACVEDAGFPAEQVSPTEAEYIFGDQMERGRETLQDCERQLIDEGLRPEPGPPSAEELSDEYDAMHEIADCLRAEGVEVPEGPSRSAYIEDGGAGWDLFANTDLDDRDTVLALQDKCID